jgi:hypothetical protein
MLGTIGALKVGGNAPKLTLIGVPNYNGPMLILGMSNPGGSIILSTEFLNYFS